MVAIQIGNNPLYLGNIDRGNKFQLPQQKIQDGGFIIVVEKKLAVIRLYNSLSNSFSVIFNVAAIVVFFALFGKKSQLRN